MKLSGKVLKDIKKAFNNLEKQYPNIDIIEDGILDIQQYENASPRILWLLKQDYYDSGCTEKDYASRIRESVENKQDGGPTWRNMSYVTYMLLHNVSWTTVPCDSLSSLLKTAVIEINKEPSETSTSPDDVILEGFSRFRNILFQQIDAYSPEIVIFVGGNGLFSIFSELSMRYAGHPYDPAKSIHIEKGDTVFFRCKDCTFIWAYHPSYLGISSQDYCEGIVEAYQASLKS